MITSSTLRPGLLVSCKTSFRGNVTYNKRTIESAHTDSRGNERESWETERVVSDPKELAAGKKALQRAAYLVRVICAKSAFGLLCPENNEEKLEAAIAEGRAICEAFNAKARLSRVSIYVVTGRIAPDDVEAMRAINSEIRDLMDAMNRGVKALDADAIRAACNKARDVGRMLSPQAEARVKMAIETARAVARDIKKAGEEAAIEIDKAAMRRITEQRTAFLDLDEAQPMQKPKARGRALDLDARRA